MAQCALDGQLLKPGRPAFEEPRDQRVLDCTADLKSSRYQWDRINFALQGSLGLYLYSSQPAVLSSYDFYQFDDTYYEVHYEFGHQEENEEFAQCSVQNIET